VTICARNHACAFGTVENAQVRLSASGRIANEELRTLAAHYVHVTTDSFVVMPNHVHFILVLEGAHRYSTNINVRLEPAVRRKPGLEPPRAGSLSAIVRSYKAGVTRRCHDSGSLNFAWQSGFYEHVLRGNGSVEKVRDYIMNNPASWSNDPENLSDHLRRDDQWRET
jgi:putative transposase